MADGSNKPRPSKTGGDIYIPMADPFDVWQKPTLYCNYPSIKEKKKQTNRKNQGIMSVFHRTVISSIS